MINITNSCVMNFENALRGARNPMNSWSKSDSYYDEKGNYCLGDNDLSLARNLCRAGSDHRKFLRQIFVSADVTAPLYWWKEYDTYKVGTVANSTSTMHKIHSMAFNIEQFSCDKMSEYTKEKMLNIVKHLEELREKFISTKDKQWWYDIVQLLPSSYNQLRTCTFNYEVLRNIYHSRETHKLDEWHDFCNYIKNLPYAKELIIICD